MKITMHVHHGNYNETEVSNGETFEVCLAYLSNTPMYIGYGPRLDRMQELKEKGQMSYGWADYNFYNDEQIATLLN